MGKSFVYNTGESKAPEEELELTFGVFIDGTLNNKTNTELRRKYRNGGVENLTDDQISESVKRDEEAYKKLMKRGVPANPTEYEQYLIGSHRTYMDKMGTDNSYSNDYTNVARMWKYCDKEYRIYVEGMGTDDKQKDSQDGFAFGAGLTGVRAKVRKACEIMSNKINEEKRKGNNRNKVLTKITIDAFGFSRGAASARNFVHEVNVKKEYEPKPFSMPDGYYPINPYSEGMPVRKYRRTIGDADGLEINSEILVEGKLPRMGHLGYSILKNTDITPEELEDIILVVRFVGIYDTVSSYGESGGRLGEYDVNGELKDDGFFKKAATEVVSTHFDDDVEELQLNNLGYFQKMVHFTAKDEHRKNFSLTRIRQIKDRAIEKNLPGVHCDIGGAYETETEYKDEIETSNHKPLWQLKSYMNELIAGGWFKDDQIEINNKFWNFMTSGLVYRKLSGTRYLKKEYSYLPLHFMEEFGKEIMKTKEKSNALIDDLTIQYSVEGHPLLVSAKSYMEGYMKDEIPEWDFVSDEELAKRKQDRINRENLEKMLEEMEKNKIYQEQNSSGFDGQRQYWPTMPPGLGKDPQPQLEQDENIRTTTLEEVVVTAYHPQTLLRKLRNEYFHWSASRDWFGMEPNNDRKRREH
ncbi:putative alpha/beta hydrolase family protein DUF2235 [Flavobacterium endophyticum]|uniref:Putative alpha/beta hydrolase family protein DUF2235 n=1 Tax=Flavobacterium endophyticum TaxID=1540163 RepID=A0A495MNM8_9FLAO|nr:DUF2235 domain-containing protein [Flavobacterium endophyticum]RKS25999.1 putative alpha/beta hydrolase family protein DUF2235 [Flavobacterium endophyticum]